MTDSNRLLEILRQQHDMLNRLAEMVRSQSNMIADGRIDQLLSLLANRQSLIDQFTASQSQMSELTRNLDERLESASGETRDEIRALIQEIGELLSQVMQSDQQDQARLEAGKNRIKQELSSTGAARQARNAYMASDSKPKFADGRG
jgi:flagellar biosynthesis/type III secretory pathway chaperone